jgi:hypothetical protein
MPTNTWSLGRTGRVYVKAEAGGYGVAPVFTATDAVRHLSINLPWDPQARVDSPERHTHPSLLARLQRRMVASADLQAQMYPSGTLNTPPEIDALLVGAFGQKSNTTLSTTFTPNAPVATLVTIGGGAVVAGAHSFKVAFKDASGETLASVASNAVTADAGNTKVSLALPLGPTATTHRVIYMTEAAADPLIAANFKKAHTIANNTDAVYVIDQSDASLTITVTGITQAAGTATATLAGHGYVTGDQLTVAGANQAGYNLSFTVLTVPLTSTWTYAVDAGTVSPATGTLTVCCHPRATNASTTLLATTGGFVASATALAVGQAVLIGGYVRWLTAVSTTNLTWAPALLAAPTGATTLKGTLGYSLTTALPTSFDVGHYNTQGNREQLGFVPDKVTITFDSNSEPKIQFTGPAQGYAAAAQAEPMAFTTVGAESAIPSGISGSMALNGTALEFVKATLEVTNGSDLQNNAFGTNKAQQFYRKSKRQVALSIDIMVSSDQTLYDIAKALTDTTIVFQCGTVEGKIWAVYCPVVEWKLPDTPDADETGQYSFKGICKGTLGNDEVYLAAA